MIRLPSSFGRLAQIAPVVLLISMVARADEMPSRIVPAPALAPGLLATNGSESVLVDLAVIPSGYLRRDLNGTAIPGGFRLSTWANLSSRSFANGKVRIVTNLRFDLDTSATTKEVNAFQPFLSPTRYLLLAAWVEADAAPGLLIRAGRQFHADAADYLAFDGGKVIWTLGPMPLRLEVYGGVRTSVAIASGSVASSLYELDGVTSMTGTQPLAGAVVRYTGDWRRRSEASVGFRWSWKSADEERALDPAIPNQLMTTAQELIAYAGSDVGPVHLSAGAAYEVVLGSLMRARASATLPVGRWMKLPEGHLFRESTASFEYRRYRPTFALDSIFNYFSLQSYDEYSVLAGNFFGPSLRGEVRLFERRFHISSTNSAGTDWTASPGDNGAHGGRLSVYQQAGRWLIDGAGQLQLGWGGTRVLADGGLRVPLIDRLDLFGRASWAWFSDDLRTSTTGNSLGLVAGATWFLPKGASVSAIVEETINPFVPAVPRFFAVADLVRWL